MTSPEPTEAPNPVPDEAPRAAPTRRIHFRALAPAARTLTLWLWAAVAGVLAALATLGFRWLTQQVEVFATGHHGGLVAAARSLTPWHRALVCTAGGLLAGLVLQWGGRWAARGPRGDLHIDYIDGLGLSERSARYRLSGDSV